MALGPEGRGRRGVPRAWGRGLSAGTGDVGAAHGRGWVGEVAQDCVHREGLSPGPTERAGPSLAQHTFSGVSVSTRHSRGLFDFGLVEVWPEFSWVLLGEGQAGSIISHFSARLETWDLVSAH